MFFNHKKIEEECENRNLKQKVLQLLREIEELEYELEDKEFQLSRARGMVNTLNLALEENKKKFFNITSARMSNCELKNKEENVSNLRKKVDELKQMYNTSIEANELLVNIISKICQ